MMNKVMLVGRLGTHPETRVVRTGVPLVRLSVGTSHYKKQYGEWVAETEWTRVTLFGEDALEMCRELRKGDLVYVEGRLRTHKWKDKEGHDRWSTEVASKLVQRVGEDMDFAEEVDWEWPETVE